MTATTFNIRNTSSFPQRQDDPRPQRRIRAPDGPKHGQPRRGRQPALVGALLYPRGNSWDDVTSYEHYNAERKLNTQYWPVGDYGMQVQNPYWVNYRNLRENKKNRYTVGASLSYKILDCLTLTGRVRLDDSYKRLHAEILRHHQRRDNRRFQPRCIRNHQKQREAGIRRLPPQASTRRSATTGACRQNFGGSISDMRYDDDAVSGPIADGSEKFKDVPVGLANFFAIQNLSTPHLTAMQTGWHEQTQSLYASADVGLQRHLLPHPHRTQRLAFTARRPQLQEVKLLLSLCGTLRADEQLLPRHQRHHAALEDTRQLRLRGFRVQPLHRQPAL